jgi:quercetin dioxygenase-like cupin family protein
VAQASRSRFLLAVALFASFALGALLPAAFAKSEVAPTAIRTALAQTSKVVGAPGRTLVLSRVVVEPGAKLALHHHRGTQVARIQSGKLRYTVRSGSVGVRGGDAGEEPNPNRKVEGGRSTEIGAGSWIVEQPSAIHRAENRGTVPVVIYLATLLKTGAAPSTPVKASPAG